MNSESLYKILEAHSLDAVDMAKDLGFTLDFSNTSVDEVEKLLQMLYEEAGSSNVSDQQYSDMAKRFGSYLGLTLIRNLGRGKWV